MRALLAGWFSFEEMGATAGDVEACDVVARWLSEWGVAYDIARAEPFVDGVDIDLADPAGYTHLVFVCGPCGNGPPIDALFERFAGCRRIGLDLSMLDPVADWNPFDLLLERDSERIARPDLALLAEVSTVPVTGLVLVHPQGEYGHKGRHRHVEEVAWSALAGIETAVVAIDTRLDENASGLRSAAQIESLIARMDIVVTTRLHGLVLSLKHGVPVVAIDPVSGGAKVTAQARALEWPLILASDGLDAATVRAGWDWCRSDDARTTARACAAKGIRALSEVRTRLQRELA